MFLVYQPQCGNVWLLNLFRISDRGVERIKKYLLKLKGLIENGRKNVRFIG